MSLRPATKHLDATQALADIERTEADAIARGRASEEADLITIAGIYACLQISVTTLGAAMKFAVSPTIAKLAPLAPLLLLFGLMWVGNRMKNRRLRVSEAHRLNLWWFIAVPLWLAMSFAAMEASVRVFGIFDERIFSPIGPMQTSLTGAQFAGVTLLAAASLLIYRTRVGMIVFVAATAIACAVALYGPADPSAKDLAASTLIALTMLGLGFYSRHALNRGWPPL